jgi:hypothetical protein
MSKKKYITDELIEEQLNKQGLSSHDGYGAEDEDGDYKRLCKHYEFELTDQWNQYVDYWLYTETTADGYEVWIATDNGNGDVNVNEDVHYYDNDLAEVLCEWIRYGSCKIYIDDMETYYVTEALETMWENMIDSIKDEIIIELEDEGYEYEDKQAVA